MRSRTSTLLLLFLLLWGTTAALPCGAEGLGFAPAPPPGQGHHASAACHAPASSSPKCCQAPKKERGEDRQGDRHDCAHACQSVAVLGSSPPALPGLGLLTAWASCRAERLSSLLILTIDHVPLR